MNKQQRLEFYKAALQDYESALPLWGKIAGDARKKIHKHPCRAGFCRYFEEAHRLDIYGDKFFYKLPELYKQGSQCYDLYQYPYLGDKDIRGISHRITALKEAIKLIEEQ